MKGRAVIKLIAEGDEEIRGKGAILVKGPDRVRIEVFGPFGQVAAVFVSNARGFSILTDKESRFFPHNGEGFFSFRPNELAGFVMGAYARAPGEGGIGAVGDAYTG